MNEGDARVGDLTDRDHNGSCRCRRRRSTSRVITGVGKHRRRVGGEGGGRVWRVLISTLDLHSARFKIEEVHGGELARTATAKTVGRSAAEVSMLTLPMISMCPRVEEDGGDGCGVWSGWLDEEPANLEPHLTVSRGLGLSLGLPGSGTRRELQLKFQFHERTSGRGRQQEAMRKCSCRCSARPTP